MPRVRILQGVSGLDFSWTPGEQVDMSDEDAARWVDGHRAELVEATAPPQPEPVETTAGRPAEKAARTSRGGGRSARPETRG